MHEVCIINYELGNVLSLKNALDKINVKSTISREEKVISKSNFLVLPGVGSFEIGMKQLEKFNLIKILNNEVLNNNKKILGICLGFQLMCKKSEEFGKINGLGWMDLNVVKINTKNLKLPHTGWNALCDIKKNNKLMQNIENENFFYFNHTFCINKNTDEKFKVLAKSKYEDEFISVGYKNNIFGIQPHPEKSQQNGLTFLKNLFVN